MKEVTKTEFFKVIGPQDVVTALEGPYPYTTHFNLRYTGREVGRIVESEGPPPVKRYLLNKEG